MLNDQRVFLPNGQLSSDLHEDPALDAFTKGLLFTMV
jgi:hypothetical protein